MTKDEALKLALEALSPDPYRSEWVVALDMDNAITAIKEALAQPEQEPVAWKDMAFARLGVVRDKMHHADVETIQRFLDGDYTTPPQRKPLTDEEIMNIAKVSCIGISPQEDTLNFAKVIEAVHGIKGEV